MARRTTASCEGELILALGRILGIIGRWWFSWRLDQMPEKWNLNGWPIISRFPDSVIHFGNNLVLTSSSRYTALGVRQPVVIRTLARGAEIVIGANTGMSGCTICAQTSVRIGANCLIGSGVTIVDTDFHPLDPNNRRFQSLDKANSRPVVIEDNVFVGGASIILKGVRIGKDSVIGAGSIVTSDIPSGVVAGGNPCRVLRSLDRK